MNKRNLARNIGSIVDIVKSSEGSEKQWLSAKEIAEELSLNVDTVYKMIQSGRLPAYDIASGSCVKKSYRIRRSDFEEWLRGRKVLMSEVVEEVVV